MLPTTLDWICQRAWLLDWFINTAPYLLLRQPRRSPRLKLTYSAVKKTCYSLQKFTLEINSFRRQLRNNCYHQKRSVNTKCTTNR